MTPIAILGGTGQQGRGLAQRFSRAGARVVVGSRDPERARAAVADWAGSGQPIEVAGNAAAVAQADLVLPAVPCGSVYALAIPARYAQVVALRAPMFFVSLCVHYYAAHAFGIRIPFAQVR